MTCVSCMNRNLKNPLEDCDNTNYMNCHSINEKSYCLTHQTQKQGLKIIILA